MPRPRLSACLALAACLALVTLLVASADAAGKRGRVLDAEASRAWRGVGRVNVGGLNTHGLCTGTLIEPDIVLTAAHCVVHQRTGKPHRLGSIYFVAGWRKGEMTGHSVAAAVAIHPFYAPGRVNDRRILTSDLALLRLREPLGPEVAEPFAIAAPPPDASPVTVVSYRKDRPHALTYQDDCSFVLRDGPLVVLECSVASGASGAPVLIEVDGEMRVFATLVAMSAEGQAFAIQVKGVVEKLRKSLDDPGPPAAAR